MPASLSSSFNLFVKLIDIAMFMNLLALSFKLIVFDIILFTNKIIVFPIELYLEVFILVYLKNKRTLHAVGETNSNCLEGFD